MVFVWLVGLFLGEVVLDFFFLAINFLPPGNREVSAKSILSIKSQSGSCWRVKMHFCSVPINKPLCHLELSIKLQNYLGWKGP